MKRRNENSDGNYNSKIPVYFRRFQTKKNISGINLSG